MLAAMIILRLNKNNIAGYIKNDIYPVFSEEILLGL